MSTVIVDGDVLVYQCLAKDQKSDLSESQDRFLELLEELKESTFCENHIVFVGGKDNFRKAFDDYKANRKHKQPHPHLYPMREWVVSECIAKPAHGAEADDFVVATAHEMLKAGEPWVIASVDKDLRNYPGAHYDTMKRTFLHVSQAEARLNYYAQLISGDSVDNIKGIHLMGAIKSKKYLQQRDPSTWPMAVAEIWQDHHPEDWRERLEKCWNLITIRTEWDDMKLLPLPPEFDVR